MKYLYVPWRSKYVSDKSKTKNENISEDICIFCEEIKQNDDEKNYILGRYKYNIIILNLYPYNAGHLMVIPYRHCKNLSDLEEQERAELMELTSKSINIVQNKLRSEGFNIGMNLGKSAGAGIPSHLHMHILPRWVGDTNFLPLLAQTKAISFDINKIYQDLKPEFEKIK